MRVMKKYIKHSGPNGTYATYIEVRFNADGESGTNHVKTDGRGSWVKMDKTIEKAKELEDITSKELFELANIDVPQTIIDELKAMGYEEQCAPEIQSQHE